MGFRPFTPIRAVTDRIFPGRGGSDRNLFKAFYLI